MSQEEFPKKDGPKPKKDEAKNIPENAGILKEKEKKDFELQVVEKLRIIGKRLTKKEISELLATLEATKSIESLKAQLSGGKEEHDKALETILSLYETIRNGAKEGIKELRIDLEKLLEWEAYVRKEGYFSKRFAFTRKLEHAELGKNFAIDIAGISVGILDSIIDALQVILEYVQSFFLLPKDVWEDWKDNRKN